MTATDQNFVMYQGNDASLVVTVEENGEPKNITGATITWGCANSATSSSIFTKTTSSGISITDAAAGEFTVDIDAVNTTAMSGEYYHEAKVLISGAVVTVLTGTMTVEPALLS